MNKNELEKLLWSIAFPGFGQLLNQQYTKGAVFIALEMIVNMKSNFNLAIILSFQGNTNASLEQIQFKWLVFYPFLYFAAIWDAVKKANEKDYSPFMVLPYVFAAAFVLLGFVCSFKIAVLHPFLDPILFPIFMVIPGVLSGLAIKKLLISRIK